MILKFGAKVHFLLIFKRYSLLFFERIRDLKNVYCLLFKIRIVTAVSIVKNNIKTTKKLIF